MHEINNIWSPFLIFGYKAPFYEINLTILKYSLIASFILILLSLIGRIYLYKKNSIINDFIFYVGNIFFDLIIDTIGYINKKIYSFIFGLFLILLTYNLLSLIPHLEEPTKDINVSIAFAIFSFLQINKIAFNELGFHYLEHWFKCPLSLNKDNFFFNLKILFFIEYILRLIFNLFFALLFFPFELLSKVSLIMSLSFRLFGNIFGGSKIIELVGMFLKKSLILKIVLTIIGLNLLLMTFFGFFEGLMQTFIFVLVSLNNIGILLGDEYLEKKSRKKICLI